MFPIIRLPTSPPPRLRASRPIVDSPERAAAIARLAAFVAPTWDEQFKRVDAFLEGLPAAPIR